MPGNSEYSHPRRRPFGYRVTMEDQTALADRLRSQIVECQYSLESLGAAPRLEQRVRIADLERRLRALSAPAAAAPDAAPVA
jgi:hypothetical protein